MNFIWQPQFDDYGSVIGHEFNTLYSFQVFSSKRECLKYFPQCIPLKYKPNAIEDYSLIS